MEGFPQGEGIMVVRYLSDIINMDITESGIPIYYKDTTINSIRRRIPIW